MLAQYKRQLVWNRKPKFRLALHILEFFWRILANDADPLPAISVAVADFF